MSKNELHFRTEDLTLEDVGKYFVETEFDRQTIDVLKSKKTVVLQGARGVGKSFLLKVACSQRYPAGQTTKQLLPVLRLCGLA